MLDVVARSPGKLMSYYVARATAILDDANAAYPRSQAISDATAQVLQQSSAGRMELNTDADALEQLQDVCSRHLQECCSAAGTLAAACGDGSTGGFNRFQLRTPRCFCQKKPVGGACHFKVDAFASLLMDEDPTLHAFYVKKANQTARLTTALQRILGFDERPITKVSTYGKGCIFGWTIMATATHAVEPAVEPDAAGSASSPPSSDTTVDTNDSTVASLMRSLAAMDALYKRMEARR